MYSNGYLIDDEIIFLPSQKTIKSKTNNQTQTLHAPAVRCLQLLIESKTMVSQADLYKAGWGEDALRKVSTATYYQCFVNLRKQLRAIGYSSELLITVPKEGMRISDERKIISFTPPPAKEVVIKTEQPVLAPPVKGKGRARWLLATALTLAVAGGFVSLFLLASPSDEENSIVLGNTRYQRYQELPQCIYVHSVQPENVDTERTRQFILAKELSCTSSGKIFIHQGWIRTTLFLCNEEMHCHSITYINKSS